MKTIICQPREQIAAFVSQVTSGQHLPWENYSAVGLVDGQELIAGVVYNHYSGANICMHVAAEPGRMWMTPEFLFSAFDYPFNQLKVRRVTGLVPKKNRDARRFDEHLGFKLEGCMRQALADDCMLIYGMLRSECKWIAPGFVEKLNRRRVRHELRVAA